MMRGCRFHRALLANHDGSLPHGEQRRLEQHLRGCTACARELAQLAETDALLSRCRPTISLLAPEEAQFLFRVALERSGAAARPARWGGGPWRWQVAGLAVLFAAFGALTFRFGGRRQVAVAAVPAEIPAQMTSVWREPGEPESADRPLQRVHQRGPVERERHHGRRSAVWVARGFTGRRDWQVKRAVFVGASFEVQPPAPPAASLEPQLVVSVSRSQPSVNVTVTSASAETPGFARAEALEITPIGQVVTAATVSTCAPESQEMVPEHHEPEHLELEEQKEHGDETH